MVRGADLLQASAREYGLAQEWHASSDVCSLAGFVSWHVRGVFSRLSVRPARWCESGQLSTQAETARSVGGVGAHSLDEPTSQG